MTDFKNRGNGVARWQTPNLDERAAVANDDSLPPEQTSTQARQEGFEQGRQEALQKFSREMQEKLAAIDDFITALQQPFDQLNEQVSEELALLAAKIAKSLVRRELRTEPETIMAVVRDTVSALNDSRQAVDIHLHPDDAAIIRELSHLSDQEQCWNLKEDPLIVRGECKVYCQDSLIDAGLEKRINLVIIQLLGDDRNEARP